MDRKNILNNENNDYVEIQTAFNNESEDQESFDSETSRISLKTRQFK
jgi:hypothetical protein